MEGFTPWSKKTIDEFSAFQRSTHDDDYQYNLGVIQKQASPSEVDELIKTGKWPWNKKTKYDYMDEVNHSTIVEIDPSEAMMIAREIYNEKAMQDMLYWNTPEGNFLVNGAMVGKFGRDTPDTIVQCGNDGVPIKRQYTSASIPNNPQTIEPGTLPDEVPGFQFNGPICNPCEKLSNPNAVCSFTFQPKSSGY